jgi:hypothetical protein
MAEVKREVWVVERSGVPVHSYLERGDGDEKFPPYAVIRYIPAESAGREGEEGWIECAIELPDTDTLVLVCPDGEHDPDNYDLMMLEISDDSEGHGKPYWTTVRGEDLPLDTFAYWRPLPSPPKPGAR